MRRASLLLAGLLAACLAPAACASADGRSSLRAVPPGFLIDGRPVHPACVRELLYDVERGPPDPVDAADHAQNSVHPGIVVFTSDGALWTTPDETFAYRNLGRTPAGTHILHTSCSSASLHASHRLLWVRTARGADPDRGPGSERTFLLHEHEDYLAPQDNPVLTLEKGTTVVRMQEATRTPGPVSPERGPVLDATYLPIGPGYRWTYGSPQGDVVFETIGSENVDGTRCHVVRRTLGKGASIFYVSVSAPGVRIHKVDDNLFVPPYLEFAFGTRLRDLWVWEGAIGGRPVTFHVRNGSPWDFDVPSATPEAISIWETMAFRPSGTGGLTQFDLVRDIGVVSLTGKTSDLHNPWGEQFTWNLREFSIPGRPVVRRPARDGR